ncbi:MAG: threonylcarbamoyl-AMP synthase [Pseudomonadales bacterium]|nr:threonylcarbamoyl-AMP synthase [Pseudomonadales bacterium]
MNQHLVSAAQIIQAGGVVAYPTESVYGLGCDPFNEEAVMRLLAIKQRPVDKGMILIGADLVQLAPWLELRGDQYQQLEQQWPAPLTYLVEAKATVPSWVRGRHAKVAVRVPDHPLARALCRRVGHPIISTSANLSGRPSARNRFQVARQLGDQLDFIVSGVCDRASKPSTIIDLESGRTLRA